MLFTTSTMEAVAAFGLAVNVLQVVEYGAKLLRSIHKIYQEGASIENEELEKVTVDLQRLNDKLRLSQATRVTSDSLPKDEQDLDNLVNDCAKVADELIFVLAEMKSEGNNRQRIRAAYKTLLGKDKLEATRKRLDTIRGELELHILVSVKEKLDLQAVSLSSLLGRLDEESRRAIEAIVDNRRSLEGALQARNAELYSLCLD